MAQHEQLAVKFLPDESDLLAEWRSMCERSTRIRFAYAWMGLGEHYAALPLEKVHRSVVGVEFAATDPAVIKALSVEPNRIHVIEPSDEVFHPKCVLSETAAGAEILIGSSNFTVGGFGKNVEANVLIRCSTGHSFAKQIAAFIDSLWDRGFDPPPAWIEEYSAAWQAREPRPRVLVPRLSAPAAIGLPEILALSWRDYYYFIRSLDGRRGEKGPIRVLSHNGKSYLDEIRACRAGFRSASSFAAISETERKRIGGLPPSNGCFGGMGAAALFKDAIHNRHHEVGKVLDLLPRDGDASDQDLALLISRLVALDGLAMTTASRLLCTKRPDLFLPVTTANKGAIKEVLGVRTDRPSDYLELHRGKLWKAPWFNSPRPTNHGEAEIWDARVALLDAAVRNWEAVRSHQN